MTWRKAAHLLVQRRTLALTAVIFGVAAATALAANVTGDGTLVGSTGPDNIAAGNGNDTIFGLGTPNGTTDNIAAGTGSDVIDGGGHCTGVAPGDYPNGLNQSGACEDGQTAPNCGQENISAGSGADTIMGDCGPNNISVGNGQDKIYAPGGPNNIRVGNGLDVIDLSQETAGPNQIITGTGSVRVYAQNGQVDHIVCGSKATVVYVDSHDITSKNCTVRKSPQPDRDTWAARRHTARRATTAHRARIHRTHKTARRGHKTR
jgi:hypothetical protein